MLGDGTKVPEYIREKEGSLSKVEMEVVRRHPKEGYDLLKNISAVPYDVLMIVLHHHENADGSGYPGRKGLRQTPKLARLVKIIDRRLRRHDLGSAPSSGDEAHGGRRATQEGHSGSIQRRVCSQVSQLHGQPVFHRLTPTGISPRFGKTGPRTRSCPGNAS